MVWWPGWAARRSWRFFPGVQQCHAEVDQKVYGRTRRYMRFTPPCGAPECVRFRRDRGRPRSAREHHSRRSLQRGDFASAYRSQRELSPGAGDSAGDGRLPKPQRGVAMDGRAAEDAVTVGFPRVERRLRTPQLRAARERSRLRPSSQRRARPARRRVLRRGRWDRSCRAATCRRDDPGR